jgi:hypothetical protein
MADRSDATTLRSRYVDQAASDLEANRRRQRELTEELATLKQEEMLLLDILSLVERAESPVAGPARRPARAEPEAPGKATTAAAPAMPAPETATEKKAAPARPARAGGPRRHSLGDLLLGLLARHQEPRLAKELRDELLREHPDRTPTPQLVRNTMESLVAKGLVRRHKQQRSVLYSPAERSQGPAGAAGAADGDGAA